MPNDSSTLCKQGAGVLIAGALMAGAAIPAQAAVVISTAATNNMSCSAGVCAPTAAAAVLNVGDLETLLASGNVEVTTTGPGVQANDVAVKAALSWSTSSALALDADRSIAINKSISVAGAGGLSLVDDGQIGALSFGKAASVAFANLSSPLSINGTSYILINTLPSLASAIANNPSGAYALISDYNASQDGTYTASPVATPFTGTFEGLGNTISKLSIDDVTVGDNVGLFAEVDAGGTVDGINLGKIELSGAPTDSNIGGLVGLNGGTVSAASVSGSLRTPSNGNPGGAALGGLVGNDDGGSIIASNSRAKLNGTNVAGNSVGGLDGEVGNGTIQNSYATGSVSTGNSGNDSAFNGGLIGFLDADSVVSGSYATGDVEAGQSANEVFVGGLVGAAEGYVVNCYAMGNVHTPAKLGYTGGLTGTNGGSIKSSYSAGAPTGHRHAAVGGFIGDEEIYEGTASHGYWDTTTSGTDIGVGEGYSDGVEGLTTTQFQSGLPKGFDKKVWAENPAINGGLPYLRAIPPK